MSEHGALTAALADSLRSVYGHRGYRILSDHGKRDRSRDIGNIASSFGRAGFRTELAQLDLAVIDEQNCAVVALVEVEESSDRPKTILGDIFAALLGSETAFDGE